jgi:hypothetical protein
MKESIFDGFTPLKYDSSDASSRKDDDSHDAHDVPSLIFS